MRVSQISTDGEEIIEETGPPSNAYYPTGQWKKGRRQWVPHVGLALFELSSLLMSDPTGKGDFHGDVEAVRQANMEDPQAKIYNGGRAVTPATA